MSPRLIEIIEWRFVQPFIDAEGKEQWRHPDGFPFNIVRDLLTEEALAASIEKQRRDCQLQAQLCKELGHEHEIGGCRTRVDVEWKCICASY